MTAEGGCPTKDRGSLRSLQRGQLVSFQEAPQLIKDDRLDEVGIETRFPGAVPIFFFSVSGHRHQNGLLQARFRLALPRDLESIDAGQSNVNKHDIRVMRAGELDGGQAIVGYGDVLAERVEQRG